MTDSPMARHNAFAAVEAAGKTLPADAIAHIWMPTKSVNDPKVGMGTLVQAGASVVRSSGYYFNSGFFNGGLDITWEDILNSDPMPPGLTPDEQSRVLGGEACMWGEVADEFFLDQKLWTRAAVVSERYWATNESIAEYCDVGFGCGKNSWGSQVCGCTWHSPSIQARLVKHRCRLLQRGIHAQVHLLNSKIPSLGIQHTHGNVDSAPISITVLPGGCVSRAAG